MLFDVRGRGRRRTIQVVYLFLAVLIGGGLVLFGVGGGGLGGGLLNGLSGNGKGGGGSSASPAAAAEQFVRRARQRTARQPRDPAAWDQLVKAEYAVANAGAGFTTGRFSAAQRASVARAATAWKRYLALDPRPVDSSTARLMTQVFGPAGLDQPAQGARAARAVVRSDPRSPGALLALASFQYLACETSAGDRARARALKVTPKPGRPGIEAQLAQAKKAAHGRCTTAAGGHGATSKGTTSTGGGR